ncbi:16S rRNA (uracil(1498)-N(3))-methyltransferase [candidate division WOR-3 bacterium]|nr:16S rRNA (uracil(1498)-N(3))-methyltransferase [candidate division WOR-3 bacterium]
MIEVFYAGDAAPDSERVAFGGAEARHICRVLRHRSGDRVRATDGRGTEFELELDLVTARRVEGRVLGRSRLSREPRKRLALAQALLKGDRLAAVVEAATEIGVSEVVPLLTERVVARPGPGRLERLRQVAVSGLKTSARTVLPRIAPVTDVAGLAGRIAEFGQTLVAYELESGHGLDDVLDRSADSFLLVVGPEGGLTGQEVLTLTRAGASCFSLGPRRLRAETAAAVGAALCLQALGEMG